MLPVEGNFKALVQLARDGGVDFIYVAMPRAIWLACLGWEATRPTPKTLPRALPTAGECALAHA